MDFTRRPRVSRPVDTLAEEYPHVLTLYKKPPDGELLLSEFETLAFDRVQVLQILEQATQMGHKLYSSEWRIAVLGYLRKQNLRRYVRLIESAGCGTADADSHIRREDYISHFILRLAYCRSKELRNWFVARELELFKMRFQSLSTDGVKQFMDSTKLGYSPISNEMKDEIKSGLLQSTVGYSPAAIDNSDFYKVPFIEVLDLVRNMSVYIHKGYAYVPTSELVSCLTSWFRTYLTDALEFANKKLPLLDDERISGLLETLHITYTGKDYTNPSDSNKFKVTTENLHTVVRKSFPLCMKSLYDVVKTTHHLRHFGRLQFTLYLKGIGLTLDDAIKYWRSEFCRLIDEETFNKKYLYNVKHAYGAIGNMTSYTPYGCKKIISASPGPGEHHGCPFKTWDSETLKQKMLESGASQEGTREVLEVATKGHYQIACSKFFMYTHGGVESQNGIINHPNQYYEQSRELLGNSASSIEASSTKKRKFPNAFGTASSHSQASSQVSNSSSQTQQSTPTTDEALFDDDLDLSQVPDTMDAE